jgi:hypothetical protein
MSRFDFLQMIEARGNAPRKGHLGLVNAMPSQATLGNPAEYAGFPV